MTQQPQGHIRRHETQTLPSGAIVHRWHPSAATARGAVVLQHGFGEYAERYLTMHHALVDHLLAAGLEVWALDLWGHGRSPGPRGVCHVGRAVADHRRVLDLAVAAGRPTYAIGHSLGGLVTAASVAGHDARLAGVVLLSPALPAPAPRPVRRVLGIVARVAPGMAIPERRRPLDELSHRPEVVAATGADDLMFQGQIGFLLAKTALDAMADVRDQVQAKGPQWAVPVLLVHGTADTYTDPSGSRDLAAAIGLKAELVLVKDGYHELLSDTDGDLVLGQLMRFLSRGAGN